MEGPEETVIKMCEKVYEQIAPGEIAVSIGEYNHTEEDRKQRRSIPINLTMSLETYLRTFVPMGYEPIHIPFCVSVHVQK